MKLYFGNVVTAATTVMILALLGFIGYSVFNRADILYWGRRSAVLLVFGLVVCCFAAARDGLDKTIQHILRHHVFAQIRHVLHERKIVRLRFLEDLVGLTGIRLPAVPLARLRVLRPRISSFHG